MAEGKRRYTDGVPDDVEIRLRELCLELPDAYEERAWAGTGWMVRKRTFAHELGVEVDDADPLVVLSVRRARSWKSCATPVIRSSSSAGVVMRWALVLDDNTDWDEVRELQA